jgi:hypothetical protein
VVKRGESIVRAGMCIEPPADGQRVDGVWTSPSGQCDIGREAALTNADVAALPRWREDAKAEAARDRFRKLERTLRVLEEIVSGLKAEVQTRTIAVAAIEIKASTGDAAATEVDIAREAHVHAQRALARAAKQRERARRLVAALKRMLFDLERAAQARTGRVLMAAHQAAVKRLADALALAVDANTDLKVIEEFILAEFPGPPQTRRASACTQRGGRFRMLAWPELADLSRPTSSHLGLRRPKYARWLESAREAGHEV